MLGAFNNGILHFFSSTFKVASGEYVGTGAALSITGLTFRPQFLIIKATGNTANEDPVMTWSGMANSVGATPATTVIDPSIAPATGIITGFDADGFTVSTNVRVNTLGTMYSYLAIAGSPSEVYISNYAGNSTDNRDITGVPFQPKFLFIRRRDGVNRAMWRMESMTGDTTVTMAGSVVFAGNQIQAINSDGFQLGTGGGVNLTGANYDYIAFNPPSFNCFVGSYTGDGADNRNISGHTFQPTVVLLNGNTASSRPLLRTTANVGDLTLRLGDSLLTAANRIQQFNSDGFQVGNSVEVNSATIGYYYIMLR